MKGVYFLANDAVYDWAIAFLNSFRRFNPETPLCLIPHDEAADKVSALKDQYQFTIFQDLNLLRECDRIAASYPEDPGAGSSFRKFAMWQGPFEEFIYADVDSVALSNFDFIFEALKSYDFLCAMYGPSHRQDVWNPRAEAREDLSAEMIRFSFNAGFFASRKTALSAEKMKELIRQGLRHTDCMAKTGEQALMNYVILKSGMRCESLYALFPEIAVEIVRRHQWQPVSYSAQRKRYEDGAGKYFFWMHWAGYDKFQLSEIDLFGVWVKFRCPGDASRCLELITKNFLFRANRRLKDFSLTRRGQKTKRNATAGLETLVKV